MGGDNIRIKLNFVPTPADDPKCIWYLINTCHCRTVADVCCSVRNRYFQDLNGAIQLSMDDAHLPLHESIFLFKDNDEVSVHWRELTVGKHDSGVRTSSPKKKKRKVQLAEGYSSSFPPVEIAGQHVKTTLARPSISEKKGGANKMSNSKGSEMNVQTKLPLSGTNTHESIQKCSQDVPPAVDTSRTTTVMSKTGGVHKRFSLFSSSSSADTGTDSETDEATRSSNLVSRVVAKGANINLGPPNISKMYPFIPRQNCIQGRGRGVPIQGRSAAKRGERTQNTEKFTVGRITGGENDQLEVISTVISVPPSESVDGKNGLSDAKKQVTKDYDSYHKLEGPPRVGDMIAFKVNAQTLIILSNGICNMNISKCRCWKCPRSIHQNCLNSKKQKF
jgi:hypothetical protein